MLNWEMVFEDGKKWTLEAGSIIKEGITRDIIVEYKTSSADLVTELDKRIENFFIENINKNYPTHYILGEEGQTTDKDFEPNEEIVWIIDPIDGTTNFVHTKQDFAISVALYAKGEPVFGLIYDPIREDLFHAIAGKGAFLNKEKLSKKQGVKVEEAIIHVNPLWLIPNEKIDHTLFYPLIEKARGIRYLGSAALEMAYIAAGRIDAYIDFRLSSWDIAAGLLILKEVEVPSTTLENHMIDVFNPGVTLMSRLNLHDEMLTCLKNCK